MWTRSSFLGLFSVEFMACHVTVGWVAPSVHTADSVKKSYSSLDVTMFISPDAVCCGARCSHVVALYVMLSWWGGFPFSVNCRCHGYGTLSLDVYSRGGGSTLALVRQM